jgi:tetratricopeptide (TPR) repeat protein
MARLLQSLCLIALLVVVGLRPLVSESYDSASNSISQAIVGIDDPSPLRTLLFDLAILAAGLVWLVSRLLDERRPVRWTGLEIGWAIVLVGAVGSCFVAGQQRLAINAAVDWLCYPVLAFVVAQVLDSRWRRQAALAVVLAAGLAQAMECAEQTFVSFPQTRAEYEANKVEFWGRQGVELDSSKVVLFEQRLKSQEATGFLSHSNVTGSVLILGAFAAAGAAIGRGRGGSAAPLWGLAGALVAAALLTRSRGAIVAAGGGIIVWLAVVRLRPWITQHARAAFFGGWAIAAAGVLAVIGHGLYHGSLPGSSLNFRWQYWETSAAMLADHPLFGVGAENFGRHYTQYKTIGSSEEVSNPHNLFVHFATNWGIIGLIGGVVMLVGATWRISRPGAGLPSTAAEAAPREPIPAWAWVAALLLAIPIGRRFLVGSDDPAYLYYTTVVTGFAWSLGLVAAWPWRESADNDERASRLGIALGLLAFVAHDLINFALFVPGAATTCFALFGIAAAGRTPAATVVDAVPGKRGRPLAAAAPLMAAVAAVALVMWFAVLPVGRAAGLMRQADAIGPDPAAADLYASAAAADPLDPTPLVKLARWAGAAASHPAAGPEAYEFAVSAVDAAMRRDPFQGSLPRLKAQLHLAAARARSAASHYLAAIDACEAARRLYPEDPMIHEMLGGIRLEAGLALDRRDLLVQAIVDLREAIRLDDARPAWEFIRRHTPRQREEIEARIREAEGRVGR